MSNNNEVIGNEVFKLVFESNDDGILIADKNKKILWSNQSFINMTGHSKSELKKMKIDSFGAEKHIEKIFDKLENENRHSWQGELWIKGHVKSMILVWVHISKIKTDEQELLCATYKPLGSGNSTDKKLLLLMQRDPLTQLNNQTYFIEQSESIISSSLNERVAIVFMDLNNFKMINDKYGHIAGNKVLIEFSKRLAEFFVDDLVARYGGDEFIVLIKNSGSKKQLKDKFDEFKKHYSEPIDFGSGVFNLALSIGVTFFPDNSNYLMKLVENADEAMYSAKSSKQDYVFYEDMIK